MSQLRNSRLFIHLQSSLENLALVNTMPSDQWVSPLSGESPSQPTSSTFPPSERPTTRSQPCSTDFGTDVLFGLEIESEGIQRTGGLAPRLWQTKSDGSLRGDYRLECVTYPLSGERLREAIRQYCANAQEASEPFSWRCSSHIHMNCLNLTAKQVAALMLLTYATDNYFYAAGDDARRCNYNCRPASLLLPMAEFLGELARCFHRGALQKAFRLLGGRANGRGEPRYVGMNWWSLRKFGTVEFRHFPGTRDEEQLSRWIRMCGKLYAAAIKYGNIPRVATLLADGPDRFGEEVFGSDWSRMTYDTHLQDWQEAEEGIDCFMTYFRNDVEAEGGLHGVLKKERVVY